METEPVHWSSHKEAAAGLGLRITLFLLRLLPTELLRLCVFPVSFFYWFFSKRVRVESRRFLRNVSVALAAEGKRFHGNTMRHHISFSMALVEKLEAWGGRVGFERIHFQDDDVQDLVDNLEKGRGALLLSSHLGNMELLRALVGFNRTGVSRTIPVNTIVDFSITANFNQTLNSLNPASMTRLVNIKDVGPDTIILLQERLAAGELVLIAGDRTRPNEEKQGIVQQNRKRTDYFFIPFLGQEAPFSYGPYFLAALLNAPTYFIFGFRQKDLAVSPQYDLHVHKCSVSFDCSRSAREERIRELADTFVKQLEYYCKRCPYQWYNFFDFWSL